MDTLLRILVFCLMAFVYSSADVCSPASAATALTLPDFQPTEFTADVEVADKPKNRVTQTTVHYSSTKNQIRLSSMVQTVKNDLYFYFDDGEVFSIDFSMGRGKCTVQDIKSAPQSFYVGGVKADGKIQEPLAMLRMTGPSGFPGKNIVVTKGNQGSIRGMTVDQYTSCQLWRVNNSQVEVVKVTHYFSAADWRFPDKKVVPVAIKVEGSTRSNMYNFFNIKFEIDEDKLETPAGVYCQRRKSYPFPPSPSYIRFSAETIDNLNSVTYYIEETFDVEGQYAMMVMPYGSDYSSDEGIGERTIFRDYGTGLSFDIDNRLESCTPKNISDKSNVRLPFDFISNGQVHQLTADAFFYKGKNVYQYLGERRVRDIMCDTFVTRTALLTDSADVATIEWYFAKEGTKSWNDQTTFYTKNHFRLPVKFRMWTTDSELRSVDMNIYHVDYSKLIFGTIDLRPCFPDSSSNFVRLVVPGAKAAVVNSQIDSFKKKAVTDIAIIADVIWWRIADLKLYFDANDVVLEFEILDAPPFAGDISNPTKQTTLAQATQNIKTAVSGQFVLHTYDMSTDSFSKSFQVSKSVNIAANKAYTGSSDDGYSGGSMAGLGIAMVIIGGTAGGAGAAFFLR
ncbi:uncharacterized protein LOC101855132 [Aplysia californica]|uniref:Uncharacterized protein LOC101855132 n=1 Tax=Aplysia californica TaxID=6500 RepID=A0ABM1A828_APLCA|nr:uncharacterized protein LOC101855132 [Aplysia californica]